MEQRPEGYGLRCPWCGEWVTPADADKPCAKSLLPSGKHPIVVFDSSKTPWDELICAER